MSNISAKVICDSISCQGIRLISMEVCCHRFILAELNTHRVFSRNYQSSRAVPTVKLIEQVRSKQMRASPVFWGKNQSGMQAAEELDPQMIAFAGSDWEGIAEYAADTAEQMLARGVHKQIVNRILEPFLYVRGIITATEWDNFFGLRLDKAAQPEMRVLAETMWKAKECSKPELLQRGQWHLPFIYAHETSEIARQINMPKEYDEWGKQNLINAMKMVSVARCARVSYTSHETGKRSTVEEDLKLCERLASMGHRSPFEHQATPDTNVRWGFSDNPEKEVCFEWGLPESHWSNPEQHGNFKGWRQYRKMMPNESVAQLPEEYRKPQ